jgi:ubiquinone/menaquinone biosynthesis C-methylase UbiE
VKELQSTYFVQDKRDKKDEITRLKIQDQMITALMGGVLPEQANPTSFHRVLDVACGTGGWIIEAAKIYPQMSFVGIDISHNMIKHAQAQAEINEINDRTRFYVMDALKTLEFPTASFDLVNLRFGMSFVRTWEWPELLGALLRITRPGGVIRLTDDEVITQSTSPAYTRLFEMARCAFFQAGHLFDRTSAGLADHLPRLLDRYGCQDVQTKVYPIQSRAGTPEGDAFIENVKLVLQALQPFIERRGCAVQGYRAIYRQALEEMDQPDFCASWSILTTWGRKPS